MKLAVNGTELYFDVVGNGLDAASGFRQKPTLIILHGGPGFDHTYLRPHLSEIKVPALVLQGRYDWVTPMAGAQEMAQQIPNAQLHVFEHSGHMVFMEEPAELVFVIKQWIASISSSN